MSESKQANLFWLQILLILAAGMIALAGKDGWGWFLFVAVII